MYPKLFRFLEFEVTKQAPILCLCSPLRNWISVSRESFSWAGTTLPAAHIAATVVAETKIANVHLAEDTATELYMVRWRSGFLLNERFPEMWGSPVSSKIKQDIFPAQTFLFKYFISLRYVFIRTYSYLFFVSFSVYLIYSRPPLLAYVRCISISISAQHCCPPVPELTL